MNDLIQLALENGINPNPRKLSQMAIINELLNLRKYEARQLNSQIGGARYNKEKLAQAYTEQLKKAINERRDSIPKSIPAGNDLVEIFKLADPSQNGKYTEWIINGYLRGGIRRLEDLLSRVKPALKNYTNLRQKKLLDHGAPRHPWTNQYDLNNFIGLSGSTYEGRQYLGLEDLLEQYQNQLLTLQTTKDAETEASREAGLVYENDLVKVYQPKTEAAACRLGRGTRWCTAATESNMFAEYSEDGPLKIIVPKQPKYVGEKYQFQHESGQYMNEKNEPVDRFELFNKYKLLDERKQISVVITEENEENDEKLKLFPENPKDISIVSKHLSEIPSWIFKIENLRKIYLIENRIKKIPPAFGKLTNLQELALGYNEISEIPPEIGQLTNLRMLALNKNKISKIPPEIGLLTNLQELFLDNNRISKIPPTIGKLTNLQELDLDYNQINEIPSEIGLLTKLQKLNLNYNQIREIPPEIGLLTNLRMLALQNNQIKKIPPKLERPGLYIYI